MASILPLCRQDGYAQSGVSDRPALRHILKRLISDILAMVAIHWQQILLRGFNQSTAIKTARSKPMPSVSTIRPLVTQAEAHLKPNRVRPFARPPKSQTDTVRFGNTDLLNKEKFSWGDKFKLAGKIMFSKQDLLSDTLWTLAGTGLVALMPPHIQAIPMLPLLFAGFRLRHALSALISPKGAVDALKELKALKKT